MSMFGKKEAGASLADKRVKWKVKNAKLIPDRFFNRVLDEKMLDDFINGHLKTDERDEPYKVSGVEILKD